MEVITAHGNYSENGKTVSSKVTLSPIKGKD